MRELAPIIELLKSHGYNVQIFEPPDTELLRTLAELIPHLLSINVTCKVNISYKSVVFEFSDYFKIFLSTTKEKIDINPVIPYERLVPTLLANVSGLVNVLLSKNREKFARFCIVPTFPFPEIDNVLEVLKVFEKHEKTRREVEILYKMLVFTEELSKLDNVNIYLPTILDEVYCAFAIVEGEPIPLHRPVTSASRKTFTKIVNVCKRLGLRKLSFLFVREENSLSWWAIPLRVPLTYLYNIYRGINVYVIASKNTIDEEYCNVFREIIEIAKSKTIIINESLVDLLTIPGEVVNSKLICVKADSVPELDYEELEVLKQLQQYFT